VVILTRDRVKSASSGSEDKATFRKGVANPSYEMEREV